jgi:NTP pyrophosphatase (non-canonical NTP hydrolase)
MKKEQIEIFKRALAKWGKDSQIYMVFEEMAELQKELCKNINRGAQNRKEVVEELADVLIMLEQVKIIFDIKEDEIENIIDYKTERLKKLLYEK